MLLPQSTCQAAGDGCMGAGLSWEQRHAHSFFQHLLPARPSISPTGQEQALEVETLLLPLLSLVEPSALQSHSLQPTAEQGKNGSGAVVAVGSFP